MTGELESVASLQVLKGRIILEIQIRIRNCRSGVSKVVSCRYSNLSLEEKSQYLKYGREPSRLQLLRYT